jgi:hypothetical protein
MFLHSKISFSNGFQRLKANLVISSPRYQGNNQQWRNEDRDWYILPWAVIIGFFNTQDHTTVVIIIAGFNVNRTTSFVYTLLCSSRKSNYSRQLFSSFITFSNNMPYGLYIALWFIHLFFLSFVSVTKFIFIISLAFVNWKFFMNNYCILTFVSTLNFLFISGENESMKLFPRRFTGNFRLGLYSH